ncbi:MAG TPA: hypothetical protein VHX63_05010 [Acidobacteriaceae bacterium]|nr:hypothetical protein [Acidobacteriaceae bacterium]
MKILLSVLMTCFCLAAVGRADTIIVRGGSSYSGQYEGGATINFTDTHGIQYQFPRRDVQSLVLSSALDAVTLRDGKSYSGHFMGANPIAFAGAHGIHYEFPVDDVDSIIFSGASAPVASVTQELKIIPIGTDLTVHTDENIDSSRSYAGQLYRASITNSVFDSAGNVAIPAGSPAKLLIRNISSGGVAHSPELILDLYSVEIGHKQFRVATSNVSESNGKGLGKNRRTAEFLGGGAALGAVLGGIFGGGRGAGIGALAGAGGGSLTQVFTRGKQVRVPAESVLQFRLERTMVLRLTP